MRKIYYRGTTEQAMSLANDIMREYDDAKQKAKHSSLEDAMQDLVDNVSDLEDLVDSDTERSLLSAEYKFAYIEKQLDVVRILVEERRRQLDRD